MSSLVMALDNGLDPESLRLDLWRQSARLYQAAGSLLKAAEAWLEVGDKNAAAELFTAVDDDFRAAELFYDCGRFSEALTCAERCRETIADKDFFRRVVLNLVQAAALIKLDQSLAANNFLRAARVELSKVTADDGSVSRSQIGRAWEKLARYGFRVERPDLIRLGYEKALLVYGSELNLLRLRCVDDYLNCIIEDKILAADLKSRIAALKCELGFNE